MNYEPLDGAHGNNWTRLICIDENVPDDAAETEKKKILDIVMSDSKSSA